MLRLWRKVTEKETIKTHKIMWRHKIIYRNLFSSFLILLAMHWLTTQFLTFTTHLNFKAEQIENNAEICRRMTWKSTSQTKMHRVFHWKLVHFRKSFRRIGSYERKNIYRYFGYVGLFHLMVAQMQPNQQNLAVEPFADADVVVVDAVDVEAGDKMIYCQGLVRLDSMDKYWTWTYILASSTSMNNNI